ncbi:MAG: tannase [Lachnospiraceae bacterium]|nr:tannase [Lachnospiraceae bacterium]
MRLKRKCFTFCLLFAVLLGGCSRQGGSVNRQEKETVESGDGNMQITLDKIDMTRWQYNKETDVYWQTGISYCSNPAEEENETLGIYVPGAYMNGTENSNGNGTYVCEINTSNRAGNYKAETAPIVIPVDTPGYSAMSAPTGYISTALAYTDAGFVYIYAGCRGRDTGAPTGVADLKAAIRYIRYNGELIPGNTERIFSFGMSGGGAQSALLGATGDSELYTPYLEAIGAVSGVSDAVAGSMCWCPITSLDYASEAYEWNMGVTRTDLTEEMQTLSDKMAERFAIYINELGLKDEKGKSLTLTTSNQGIYQAGSYYDYLKSVIEGSLNHFLEDTTFPYTPASQGKGGFGGRNGEGGNLPDEKGDKELGGKPGERELEERGKDLGEKGDLGKGNLEREPSDQDHMQGADDASARDGIARNETTGGISLSGTYETVQDYIKALNAEKTWVIYDSKTNTASITSIADFVSALKIASKDLGAFDALDSSQGENTLFGYGDGKGAHFDAVMAKLLAESDYGTEYADDLKRTDAMGTSVADRVNMYNPMYYLCDYYRGYQTANVATHWRIRTGINQSDTALTTEVNLALALENYGADVNFETVWGQAHVEAERNGNSSDRFIAWVNACYQ